MSTNSAASRADEHNCHAIELGVPCANDFQWKTQDTKMYTRANSSSDSDRFFIYFSNLLAAMGLAYLSDSISSLGFTLCEWRTHGRQILINALIVQVGPGTEEVTIYARCSQFLPVNASESSWRRVQGQSSRPHSRVATRRDWVRFGAV